MPDPNQNIDPTAVDPTQTVDPTGTTPNFELFNPKPNAWQIIGEALSRRPNIVENLFGGFMSDYGRRQSAKREIPALEALIAQEQGQPLTPDMLKQIGQMDPENAMQELSIMQSQAMRKKSASKLGTEGLWWNRDKQRYEYLPKEGIIGKQYIPAAQEIAQEKGETKDSFPSSPWKALYESQDPNVSPEKRELAKRAYDKWTADQNQRMQLQASVGTTLRDMAHNDVLMNTPWAANPKVRGTTPIDKTTGIPLRGLITKDVYSGYNAGKIGVARETDLPAIRNISSIGHTLDTLDQLGHATYKSGSPLLPESTGGTLGTIAKTGGNAWKMWVKGLGGDPNAKLYEGIAGTGLPLQIQKLLTGSTRPVNLQEFNRITGTPLKAKLFSTQSEQVKALTPTPYDTKEQFEAKIKFLKQLQRDQMSALVGAPPSSNAYQLRNDDPDTSSDRTGIDDADGGPEGTDY
jgi:hypothetical protein